MAINIDAKSIPLVREDIQKIIPRIQFWRDAIDGEFSAIFYDVQAGAKPKDDKYFKRLDFETDVSYLRRATFAKDYTWSEKIISSYAGFFSNSKIDVQNIGKFENEFLANPTGKGEDIQYLKNEIFKEFLSVGSAWCMVDTFTTLDESGNIIAATPYIGFIPRENIMDFEINIDESFKWVKFKILKNVMDGISRKTIEQIWVVDADVYSIWEIPEGIRNEWENVDTRPNTIGVVPIVMFRRGRKGIPIINTIAKFQLDLMNFMSEIRNTISIQAINLLQMSETMAKKFNIMAANSILIYEDGTADRATWIAPRANTMEPAFKLLAIIVDTIRNLSNINRKDTNQAETAESRAFDWLDTEAILITSSDEIENGMNKLAKLFGRFGDEETSPNSAIDRSFIDDNQAVIMDNLLKADLLGMDAMSKIAMVKKARDILKLNMSEDDIKKSNAFIEQMENEDEEKPDDVEIEN